MLASLTNINKFYNGNQVLCNVSLTIDENDKIGLVGNNGCGKSTLLKILTGSVEPDRFTVSDVYCRINPHVLSITQTDKFSLSYECVSVLPGTILLPRSRL